MTRASISILVVLCVSSSQAFQHTFLSSSSNSAHGKVGAPLLHGVAFTSNDASIASDICNPFGNTVCPPPGDAVGAVEEISRNAVPTPDLGVVAASVTESITNVNVKLPKVPSVPSNAVNLDFSTLKPGPQASEGFLKVRGERFGEVGEVGRFGRWGGN